jgi:hypothetical protein
VSSQLPRLHVAPPRSRTFGDLAADLAAAYDLEPDPWQRLILEDWLAERHGKWAALTCGLSVPRQNGKNAVLEMRELFGMVGRGEKILHTAHQVKTAQKHFRRLKHFFGSKKDDPGAKFPELNALVTEVRNVNGQEAIYLANGGSVEIVARSQGSGRGFTVDVIVCDEAQDMGDDDQEALLSTSSASPLRNPQWIYTGTPPGPKAVGEVFSRIRGEILDGRPSRQAWHEWSCEPDTDADDRVAWAAVNPGLESGRLQIDVIEGERANLSESGFKRERLGMWETGAHTGVIPAESWQAAKDPSSAPVDRLALGIEVGPDLAWASVSIAGQRADGSWHIALEADQNSHGKGVDWLIPYVRDLVALNPTLRTVVVDAVGPAKALLEQRGHAWFLNGTRVRVQVIKTADIGATCTTLLSGVVTADVRHMDQPQLSAAALSAGKRVLADSGMWVWSRRTATSDITPIQAATLALHGAQTTKAIRPARATGSGRRVVTG